MSVGRRLAGLLGRRLVRRAVVGNRRRPRRGPRQAGRAPGLRLGYQPRDDACPDPGEIVWTWVPYEDDPSQGKDRPVLLVGRDGDQLVGVALTSQDHDHDAADEARHGRTWVDIGSGDWDAQRRPSEARVDRLLPIDPHQVRREGATLDRSRFDAVVAALRQHLPGRDSGPRRDMRRDRPG
jgi:PemK-like, MazF-like toxin of type II toxin-antitoxin system